MKLMTSLFKIVFLKKFLTLNSSKYDLKQFKNTLNDKNTTDFKNFF